MSERTGACRCGRVWYAAAGGIKAVVNCHCAMCRQMNGAAFSTYAVVSENGLSVTRGGALLAAYTVVGTATRHFCPRCGSPLFNTNPDRYPGLAMLYLGGIRGHEDLSPGANIHCDSKLPWVDAVARIPGRPGGPRSG